MDTKMKLFDLNNSLFEWTTHEGSEGGWSVESFCRVDGEIYIVLPKVVACDVYGENSLFLDPAYDYQAVFGQNDFKTFRTYKRTNQRCDSYDIIRNVFSRIKQNIVKIQLTQLTSFMQMKVAMAMNKKLYCVAKYIANGRLVELTFGLKHINFSTSNEIFQVETGPVLVWNNTLQDAQVGHVAFQDFETLNLIDSDSKIITTNAEIKIYSI